MIARAIKLHRGPLTEESLAEQSLAEQSLTEQSLTEQNCCKASKVVKRLARVVSSVVPVVSAACLSLVPASCSNAGRRSTVDGAAARVSLVAHPGGCRGCHRDMGTALPSHPPPAKICLECHASLADHLEKEHGPFALRDCRACHVPHTSSFPALSRRPQPQLCSYCHTEWPLCPSSHGDAGRIATGSQACSSCHGAHGGKKPFMLLPDHPAPAAGTSGSDLLELAAPFTATAVDSLSSD